MIPLMTISLGWNLRSFEREQDKPRAYCLIDLTVAETTLCPSNMLSPSTTIEVAGHWAARLKTNVPVSHPIRHHVTRLCPVR